MHDSNSAFDGSADRPEESDELESAKKKEGEEELLSLEKAYSTKKAEYDAVKKELDNAQAVSNLT